MTSNSVYVPDTEREAQRVVGSARYKVDRIGSVDGLNQLEASWKEVVAGSSQTPIFLTWEWISTWWRHYGDDHELWLLTVADGASERLVGIAPWMRSHRRAGPLGLRTISFIGSGLVYPAHLGVIARDDQRDTVTATLVQYLYEHEDEWDFVDFASLRPESALIHHLRNQARHEEQFREYETSTCHFVELPADWQSYQMNSLSANRRQQLRKSRRKLEGDFPDQVLYEQISSKEALHEALDELITLSRQRWNEQGMASSFEARRLTEFHYEMAPLALDKGWLRFYRLAVNGEVAALRYGFLFRGVFYDYQLTFNPDWDAYRPGELLLAYVVERAIAEGAREFDLLRGSSRWKRSWSTGTRHEPHILITGGWRGSLWRSGVSWAQRAIEVGKSVLPDPVQRHAARLLFERQHDTTND